jgi:hypothetical protein
LTGIKKNKKTKPLDAPNLQKNQKKQNFQQLPRSGPIAPGNFVFLVFLVPVDVSSTFTLVFLFFLVPANVLETLS